MWMNAKRNWLASALSVNAKTHGEAMNAAAGRVCFTCVSLILALVTILQNATSKCYHLETLDSSLNCVL